MRALSAFVAAGLVAGIALAGAGLRGPSPQDPVQQDPTPQDPAPQDRVRRAATPPANPPTLPPVAEVPGAEVTRRDLIQRFLPPSPLEGAWRLQRFVMGARDVESARGYLTFTRTTMQLYILQAEPPIRVPLVQAGARSYRIEADQLVSVSLSGHDNHRDGSLRFEPPGMVERRSFRLAGANLRIEQSDGVYMDFIRVE